MQHFGKEMEYRPVGAGRILTQASRPRILFATSVIPAPVSSDRAQRTDQTLRALLAIGAKVHIVVLNMTEAGSSPQTIAVRLRAAYPGCDVTVLTHPMFLSRAERMKAGAGMPGSDTIRLADAMDPRRGAVSRIDHCPRSFREQIQAMLDGGSWDVYFSDSARITPVEGYIFSGLRLCDSHDLHALELQQLQERHGKDRMRLRLFCAIHRTTEKRLLKNFDKILAASPAEAAVLGDYAGTGTDVIHAPVSFEPKATASDGKATARNGLLIAGSSAGPDVDGLLWFLDRIFPEIPPRIDATLTLVGSVCRNRVVQQQARRFGDKVVLAGYHEDAGAFYRSAQMVICPVRYGNAMKTKTVEALSHSSAIIGTSQAFSGIDARPGMDALIADDEATFIAQLIELHEDQARCAQMRVNAGALFDSRHCFARYVETIATLIDMSGPESINLRPSGSTDAAHY
ncbi:glycosyltransferase family 4 protein [Rhizobium halophytocola]|uniref:Glycosyltransferase n=1 Tax=Rhizobium halophytocola TaxID=735519 RepID=A0ABS4E6L6_9HYPH|nr:glycosyltransferase family 4 protein [Rhizobium halophytocola]MBP1853584.1 hypothetical protein [Rhizobium halophytocola]